METLPLDDTLLGLQSRAEQAFLLAQDESTLRVAHARFLGRSGELTAVLKDLGKMPAAERKPAGQRINVAKEHVEALFARRLAELLAALRQADLDAPPFDLSLPGRSGRRGHLHPITQVKLDILEVFKSLGFAIADGPQVELEENNFGKLGFPPDHPAMDMHDTFWVTPPPQCPDARVLLRTHTSAVQIREMLAHKPPLAIVSAGPCFRCDEDMTHTPMFHQMEAFLVDEGVSFAHLKGVLSTFITRLFGDRPVRFRPSYFPFVEPGTEVDMGCPFCAGKGCRVCKHTGWVEILGAGMIHPTVLKNCGLDPERYSGFAFGTGIERPALLKYGIPDLRLMFENDVRFLEQF